MLLHIHDKVDSKMWRYLHCRLPVSKFQGERVSPIFSCLITVLVYVLFTR